VSTQRDIAIVVASEISRYGGSKAQDFVSGYRGGMTVLNLRGFKTPELKWSTTRQRRKQSLLRKYQITARLRAISDAKRSEARAFFGI
jgi:hypothetical protein